MNTKANTALEKLIGFWKGLGTKKTVVLVATLLILLSAGIIYAQQTGDQTLEVQGNLKVSETDLNSILDGTIEEICVEEGDFVNEGDALLRLDSESILAKQTQAQAALLAAQGQLQAAQATYQKAQNGARSEDLQKAKSAYEYANKMYERMKSLYEEGAIAQSDFDQAEMSWQVAKSTYTEALNGARSEDIAAAAATVKTAEGLVMQAQGAVDEVNSYVSNAAITAPFSGVVTSINVEKGQLISTGMSLASVADYTDCWVEVNVDETYLSMVSPGAVVPVSLLAYPGRSFEGTIVKINQNPDFAVKRATNNNGEFDILSYGVKITLPEMKETLYPGMTVIVDFGKKPQELR